MKKILRFLAIYHYQVKFVKKKNSENVYILSNPPTSNQYSANLNGRLDQSKYLDVVDIVSKGISKN